MSRFSRYAGSRPRTRLDAVRPNGHPALVNTTTSRGDLGDEIRRRRKDAKMTQADLAKLAAVATTNIGKIERGDPVSATTMRAVARALDLPVEMTAPFISESAEAGAVGDDDGAGLTAYEKWLTRKLRRRGWSPERVADLLDVYREDAAALPTVEQQPDAPQSRNVVPQGRPGESETG